MAENPLIVALMITAMGMGLLFLALAFFYGLLSGMARGLKDRAICPGEELAPAPQGAGEEAPSLAAAPSQAAERVQAAAVAIALARARAQAPPRSGPTPLAEAAGSSEAPSAWWSLHHQRRLASRASRGRSA